MIDEDLNLIFSRFGTILSCEVIRDKRTGDSLQYAFIEFDNQKDCEQAYFKMQGVLIDDHRIHVDFSQSVRSTLLFLDAILTTDQVSKLSESWRNATVTKRKQRGGFGGVADLEQKRQYRGFEYDRVDEDDDFYGMVFDKRKEKDQKDQKDRPPGPPPRQRSPRQDSYRDRRGSRSPRGRDSRDRYRRRSYSRSPRRDSRRDRDRGQRDRRDDRRR